MTPPPAPRSVRQIEGVEGLRDPVAKDGGDLGKSTLLEEKARARKPESVPQLEHHVGVAVAPLDVLEDGYHQIGGADTEVHVGPQLACVVVIVDADHVVAMTATSAEYSLPKPPHRWRYVEAHEQQDDWAVGMVSLEVDGRGPPCLDAFHIEASGATPTTDSVLISALYLQ